MEGSVFALTALRAATQKVHCVETGNKYIYFPVTIPERHSLLQQNLSEKNKRKLLDKVFSKNDIMLTQRLV